MPPATVRVSVKRLISIEPESPATVRAVPTAAVDTAVTKPLALTVTTGIRVCEPNCPTLELTVANAVAVLTEVMSPVKFGMLVVVVAVPLKLVAVTTPETLTSPLTSILAPGFVVPMPSFATGKLEITLILFVSSFTLINDAS